MGGKSRKTGSISRKLIDRIMNDGFKRKKEKKKKKGKPEKNTGFLGEIN